MKGFTLTKAIQKIASHLKINAGTITMIQYEDGSGYKFNYSINSARPSFINLQYVIEIEKDKKNLEKEKEKENEDEYHNRMEIEDNESTEYDYLFADLMITVSVSSLEYALELLNIMCENRIDNNALKVRNLIKEMLDEEVDSIN